MLKKARKARKPKKRHYYWCDTCSVRSEYRQGDVFRHFTSGGKTCHNCGSKLEIRAEKSDKQRL